MIFWHFKRGKNIKIKFSDQRECPHYNPFCKDAPLIECLQCSLYPSEFDSIKIKAIVVIGVIFNIITRSFAMIKQSLSLLTQKK